MKYKQTFLSILACGALFLAFGEDAGTASPVDSVKPAAQPAPAKAPSTPQEQSTLVLRPKIATYDYDAIPKDPLASTIMSATLPGSGQIYNKEYLRGILTGLACYGSIIGIQLLIDKWTQINTDTVHLAEADPITGTPNGSFRDVYVMRETKDQVGLPVGDKALLVGAITLCAASYIFGLVDSYKGAQRYNKKLLENQQLKFGVIADPIDKKIGLSANLRF
jgi:TM2 domain-containing membrane protein YozV